MACPADLVIWITGNTASTCGGIVDGIMDAGIAVQATVQCTDIDPSGGTTSTYIMATNTIRTATTSNIYIMEINRLNTADYVTSPAITGKCTGVGMGSNCGSGAGDIHGVAPVSTVNKSTHTAIGTKVTDTAVSGIRQVVDRLGPPVWLHCTVISCPQYLKSIVATGIVTFTYTVTGASPCAIIVCITAGWCTDITF